MRAALLCPGPSLERYAGRDGYDLVIAVNRAATRYECDYWIAQDHSAYGHSHRADLPKLIGKPTWITNPSTHKATLGSHPESKRLAYIARNSIDFPSPPTWRTWSATIGLALAAWRGATHIDCYGVDWTGTKDFDGVMLPEQIRDRRRWQREINVWRGMYRRLSARGITFTRIGHEAEDVGFFDRPESDLE